MLRSNVLNYWANQRKKKARYDRNESLGVTGRKLNLHPGQLTSQGKKSKDCSASPSGTKSRVSPIISLTGHSCHQWPSLNSSQNLPSSTGAPPILPIGNLLAFQKTLIQRKSFKAGRPSHGWLKPSPAFITSLSPDSYSSLVLRIMTKFSIWDTVHSWLFPDTESSLHCCCVTSRMAEFGIKLRRAPNGRRFRDSRTKLKSRVLVIHFQDSLERISRGELNARMENGSAMMVLRVTWTKLVVGLKNRTYHIFGYESEITTLFSLNLKDNAWTKITRNIK